MKYAPLAKQLDALCDRLDQQLRKPTVLTFDEIETIEAAAKAIRDLHVGLVLAVDALSTLQGAPNDPISHRIALDTLARVTPTPTTPAPPAKEPA